MLQLKKITKENIGGGGGGGGWGGRVNCFRYWGEGVVIVNSVFFTGGGRGGAMLLEELMGLSK